LCDKYVAASQALHVRVNAQELRATASGYTAVNLKIPDHEPVTNLGDVVGKKSTSKFTLVKWDGK
jgi:hypothetical protein